MSLIAAQYNNTFPPDDDLKEKLDKTATIKHDFAQAQLYGDFIDILHLISVLWQHG